MVMKKINLMFKPPQKMQHCDICGEDHPRGQCLLRQDQQQQRAPRARKWCNFCQIWTNQETQECYFRIRFMREQAVAAVPNVAPQQPQYAPRVGNPNYGNPNYGAQGAERAQPVLGSQPPLPRAAPVRLLRVEEYNQEGTMVLVDMSRKALIQYLVGLQQLPLTWMSLQLLWKANIRWIITPYGS